MSEQNDDPDRTVTAGAMRARAGDMLPGRASDPGGTAADSRLFTEAVPWRFRTGSPWRDLPARFGNRNGVSRRFRRRALSGVLERVSDALSEESGLECVSGGGTAAPSFCRAAGRDAAGAGVRGLRQADGPAFVVVEGLASSRLGRVEAERSHFRCRSCGKGRFPPDRALGLEGGTVTPGMASVIAGTVPLMGFEAASRHVDSLAGVDASSSALQRRAPELGEAAARFEREEVVDGRPLEPRMQLSVDGTGVPMRREETEGVRGRQADGTSKTREARLAVACTAEGRDPGTGAALKDRGSESSGCLTGGAAAPSGGREASDFAARRDREARRRGLHDAGGPVVVSDGADWIPNACEELFGGRKVTFVPGLFHCLERASDAARRSCRRGRSGTGGSRRRGGRQGGPGGEGGPGAGALQGPARGSRGLLPAFRDPRSTLKCNT